jgi:putative membrane protein
MRRSTWSLDGGGHPVLGLIVRVLINAVSVWVASHLIPGITPLDHLSSILLVAVILGVVNALIKPVFKFITCPVQILTLGLFTLVINAFMLGATAWIAEQLSIPFAIDGFIAAFLGALVISLVSWLLTSIV